MNLVEMTGIKKYFPLKNNKKVVIKAVDDITFAIPHGTTFGLVGESGCGKSTTARLLIKLYPLTAGKIVFDGKDITDLKKTEQLDFRREMQMVFQDPYASLNPRMTVEEAITDPLKIYNIGTDEEQREKLFELMGLVGLDKRYARRYPHEFSGGQRQRIGIARALALNPKLVILDEPVSALDVSVQSQVLNLLLSLQEQLQLTYLFISHNLNVINYMCEIIAVMYLGRIVELARREDLYNNPAHPYTQALLSAVPTTNIDKPSNKILLSGDLPSQADPPGGCSFHTRCRCATDICSKQIPQQSVIADGHIIYCHRYNKA